MVDVKPYQIWEVYSWDEKRWRRVAVVDVLLATEARNVVTLQYLDVPAGAPDFEVDRVRMEREPQSFRYVGYAPV